MIIEFAEKYLQELYEKGQASGKHHRYQKEVVNQYIRTVDVLKNAPDTEFLYKLKSLHYEKKVGSLRGVEVVYVNKQYRLEFISRIGGEAPDKIIICSLLDLSSHYK